MGRNKKKRLNYGELTDLVLEAIAKGLIEGLRGYPSGFRLPVAIGYLIQYILEVKKTRIKKDKIKNKIEDLEKRDILTIEEKENQVYIHLKEKGEKKIVKYSLKLLIDFKKKEKKWNGRWFLVFFDVPEAQRLKRDYLRKLLKEIGFYQYQKSVYLFPYECGQEVALIKKMVEGAKYMKYIIAEKIEDEAIAKRFFKLSS